MESPNHIDLDKTCVLRHTATKALLLFPLQKAAEGSDLYLSHYLGQISLTFEPSTPKHKKVPSHVDLSPSQQELSGATPGAGSHKATHPPRHAHFKWRVLWGTEVPDLSLEDCSPSRTTFLPQTLSLTLSRECAMKAALLMEQKGRGQEQMQVRRGGARASVRSVVEINKICGPVFSLHLHSHFMTSAIFTEWKKPPSVKTAGLKSYFPLKNTISSHRV